jgi:hypothetical protein
MDQQDLDTLNLKDPNIAWAILTPSPHLTDTSDLSTFNDTSFWCQEFIKPVAQLDAVAYLKALAKASAATTAS